MLDCVVVTYFPVKHLGGFLSTPRFAIAYFGYIHANLRWWGEMLVDWTKCVGGHWCSLNRVNLEHEHFNNLEGVYIIWHSGSEPATVYVGQGQIKTRLTAHRSDDRIMVYSHLGLLVTWAKVEGVATRNGVERFLFDRLKPKENVDIHSVVPITVNFPW